MGRVARFRSLEVLEGKRMKKIILIFSANAFFSCSAGLQTCMDTNQFEHGYVSLDIIRDIQFLDSTRTKRLALLKERHAISNIETLLEFRGIEAFSVFTVVYSQDKDKCYIGYMSESRNKSKEIICSLEMKQKWWALNDRLPNYRYTRYGRAFGLRRIYLSLCKQGDISKFYCFDYPKRLIAMLDTGSWLSHTSFGVKDKAHSLTHLGSHTTDEFFLVFFTPIMEVITDVGLKDN